MGQIVSAAVHRPEITSIKRSTGTGAIVVHAGPAGYNNALTLFFHADEGYRAFVDELVEFRTAEVPADMGALYTEEAIGAIRTALTGVGTTEAHKLDLIAEIVRCTP